MLMSSAVASSHRLLACLYSHILQAKVVDRKVGKVASVTGLFSVATKVIYKEKKKRKRRRRLKKAQLCTIPQRKKKRKYRKGVCPLSQRRR
jgi:hypothetical protein